MVSNAEFCKSEVFIDYPFESVAFHWKQGGQVVRKFYGQPEEPTTFKSDLFRDAQRDGVVISALIYASK